MSIPRTSDCKSARENRYSHQKAELAMIVDKHTGMKFSAHYETKSAIVEPTCCMFKKMEDLAGKPVKILCQDYAGKNKKLQEQFESADWSGKLKIAIKCTVKGTPQQNHLSELGFTVIAA